MFSRVLQQQGLSRHSFPMFVRLVPSVSYHCRVEENRISKNMILKKLESRPGSDRPLVLLFDWLFAKPTALKKYCELYHKKEMDVLVINGKLRHFLWPPTGIKLAEHVLDYILNGRSGKDTFLVHAFSIGAYVYTLMMIQASHDEKFRPFRDRVLGQVLDSIVIGSYDNMSSGIASTFTANKTLKNSTLFLMNLYYNSTRKHTRDRYDEFVAHFIHSPIQVPTLVFYALNDPMSDPTALENMLTVWRRDLPPFDVQTKSWAKSVHAAHLKYHERDYKETLEKFIQKVVP